jgi:hypothetical protein
MASKDGLTEVLRGRRIRGTHISGDTLKIHFDDGSMMSVRVGGGWSPAVMGLPVKTVCQEDTTLRLEFEGGKAMVMHTAAPRSSVTVRDRKYAVQYAD